MDKVLRCRPEGRDFCSRREFFLGINLPAAKWPSVDSASDRHEYQEYLLGVKAAGVCGWQLYHLHVLIVMKSRSLKLLETSEPVQTCIKIILPLLYPHHASYHLYTYKYYSQLNYFTAETINIDLYTVTPCSDLLCTDVSLIISTMDSADCTQTLATLHKTTRRHIPV